MRCLSAAGLSLTLACLTWASFMGKCTAFDKTCDALDDHQIDWDCIFGPGALKEVHDRGGKFTTCPRAQGSRHPCSKFIVPKEAERSEVKVNEGPDEFSFRKGERYIFRYSFRPKGGMRVGKQYTHFGQLKGSRNKNMMKGPPIFSLTANTDGLMVRFSNLESIENFHSGFEKHLSWDDAQGQWVHVKIVTVFGESMKVKLSGAVKGVARWPSHLKPVAWHSDAKMVRMKLGLYHKTNKVHDGEVEYRDIMIKGPGGVIRTSPAHEPAGSLYVGCFKDSPRDRILDKRKFVDAHMTTTMCADLCDGMEFFGTQFGTECWCGNSKSDHDQHGKSNGCNMDCAGNDRIAKCGGRLAMSVYQNEAVPKHVPDDVEYLGCFEDDPRDRALTLRATSDASGMSYQTCRKFCKKEDARYFGVQFGKECFCGKSKDDYDENGPATCDMPCPGKPKSICGGRSAMNVFKILG